MDCGGDKPACILESGKTVKCGTCDECWKEGEWYKCLNDSKCTHKCYPAGKKDEEAEHGKCDDGYTCAGHDVFKNEESRICAPCDACLNDDLDIDAKKADVDKLFSCMVAEADCKTLKATFAEDPDDKYEPGT